MTAQTSPEQAGGTPDPINELVELATTYPSQFRDGSNPDHRQTWDLSAAGKSVTLDTRELKEGVVTVEIQRPSRRMRGAVATALGISAKKSDRINLRLIPTAVGSWGSIRVGGRSDVMEAQEMLGLLRAGGLGARSRFAQVLRIGKD